MFYYLESKSAFVDLKKKAIKKSKNLLFFQKGLSMVLVKNWEFCDFVIVDKKVTKRCFTIFKKDKTAF